MKVKEGEPELLTEDSMTYTCPSWEFVADTHLIKLQCLQRRFSVPLANFQGAPRFMI
jgi:hypothetical protein